MNFDTLPIVDWELAIKLAGNKKEIATEIFGLLIKNLPADLLAIQKLHREKNYDELLKKIHQFHGGLCYCGLPRLKTLVSHLETELKNNIMDSLPSLLDQLDVEINLLLQYRLQP